MPNFKFTKKVFELKSQSGKIEEDYLNGEILVNVGTLELLPTNYTKEVYYGRD